MLRSWRTDRWLGTIFLSQGCFRMSQVSGLWSDYWLTGSYPLYRLTANRKSGTASVRDGIRGGKCTRSRLYVQWLASIAGE
jgi:hypothetical protein